MTIVTATRIIAQGARNDELAEYYDFANVVALLVAWQRPHEPRCPDTVALVTTVTVMVATARDAPIV